MHNNYYFFQHLVPSLNSKLKEAVLTNCFSQNKDELIIEFRLPCNEYFFVKASLESQFSCLSFPNNFHRAKRNSINIFDEIRGHKLLSITSVLNERAFIFNFELGKKLLFKLFGNQSNIIYLKNNTVTDLFKNKLKRDREIDITLLDRRSLDTSYQALKSAHWNVRQTIPTLDKDTAQLLFDRLTLSDNKEKAFDTFMKELQAPTFYIDSTNIGYRLNLIKSDFAQSNFSDPILAITTFFDKQIKHTSINGVKTKLITTINSQLTKSTNYIKKLTKKLNELSEGSSNQQKADILMANLHAIKMGTKVAELFNFYNNSTISINLNPLQTPQKNAERYYRKAKNEAKEIAILTQNIKSKSKVIADLTSKLSEIESCSDIKHLLKQVPSTHTKAEEPLAYKVYRFDEYQILVGKNAKHNDTLTLKVAKKDDLWLHAKDVSGSHVVIKQIPGKPFSKYIIEKAAQLAAYHSKRKTDTLCPVLYTPKKYVRKKKGTPAGAMFVEKEKVLLVEPSANF